MDKACQVLHRVVGALGLLSILASGSGALAQSPEITAAFKHHSLRCGPLALQACASFLNVQVGAQDVLHWLPDSGEVTTFEQLMVAAERLGLTALPMRWRSDPVLAQNAPAILAIKFKSVPHFVAAVGRRGNRILIIDFPDAAWMDVERLRNDFEWNGEALHIGRDRLSLAPLYALLYWKSLILTGIACVGGTAMAIKRWRAHRKPSSRFGELPSASHVLMRSLVCLACGFTVGCTESDGRSIRLEPRSFELQFGHDGGEEDKERSVVLQVVNEGNMEAHLLKVVALCGCTAVGEPNRAVIAAGESANIPVRMQLPDLGEKRTRIDVLVQTADSVKRTLSADVVLRGRAISVPKLARLPREIVVREGADGKGSAAVQVETHEQSGSPNWITGVTVDQSGLSLVSLGVSEGKTSESGAIERKYSYLLETQRDALHRDGSTWTACVALNGAEGSTVAKLYVRLEPWKPIRLVPQALFASSDNFDGNIVREVHVVFADASLSADKVVAQGSDPWIKVDAVKEVDSHEAIIALDLRPPRTDAGNAVHGSLAVRVAGAGGAIVEKTLPIIVRCSSRTAPNSESR